MPDTPRTDTRNVTDEFKGISEDDIVDKLDTRGVSLQIAIENLERDFNMGSIVRSANAFGVRHVHVIGRRQWNKRGAMATDKYVHVHYHATASDFVAAMSKAQKTLIAVEATVDALPITDVILSPESVMIFGSEANGISDELLTVATKIVEIPQRGSTRSMNVGAAAAVAMYEWCRQNV